MNRQQNVHKKYNPSGSGSNGTLESTGTLEEVHQNQQNHALQKQTKPKELTQQNKGMSTKTN